MTEPLLESDDLQELLARYLAGESSPEERERVRRWAASDPGRQRELATLQEQLDRLSIPPRSDLDVEGAWRRVAARMHRKDVRPLVAWYRRPVLATAAVIGLIGLGGMLLWRARQGHPVARELSTGTGRRDSVRFTDGTRIVVAAGSHLSLVHREGDRPREVRLEGEAFFDVRHDASRPFTVRTAHLLVTDLGTVFSVRSWGGGTEVRVMAGTVSLQPDGADSSVVLREGQRGTWQPGQGFGIFHGLAPRPPAWLEGRLEFEDASLPEVAQDLKRWYGIELRLADSALARRHLTATFAGEAGPRVLEIVALTLGASLELRGDTAILRDRPGLPSSR